MIEKSSFFHKHNKNGTDMISVPFLICYLLFCRFLSHVPGNDFINKTFFALFFRA